MTPTASTISIVSNFRYASSAPRDLLAYSPASFTTDLTIFAVTNVTGQHSKHTLFGRMDVPVAAEL